MENQNQPALPPLPGAAAGDKSMNSPFGQKIASEYHEPEPMVQPSVGSPVPVTTVDEEVVVKDASPIHKDLPLITIFGSIIGVLLVAIGGMLLLTDQGRRIIGLSTTTTSSITSSSESTTTSAAEDFSDSSVEETVNQVTDEIDGQTETMNPDEDFETFDSEVEFGL